METSGADPAARPSLPSAVPAPGFKTSRHGFDQGQVLEYLGHLTERLQTVENLERRLRSEIEQVQGQRDSALRERDALVLQRDEALRERDAAVEERVSSDALTYEQVSGRVTELLVSLDRELAKIRTEAEAEAGQIVSDARTEAHRMRLEAEEARNAAAHEAKQARKEAERSVTELTARRDSMLGELRNTFGGMLDVIGKLAASIDIGPDEGEGKVVTSIPAPEDRADRTVVLPDVLPDRPA